MRLFTLTASFLAVSSILFGAGKDQVPPKQPARLSSEGQPTLSAYNAPSSNRVRAGYDVFATASFIYWQPIQENMELGVVTNSSNPSDLVNGKVVNLNFDYKPGLKLGVGMDFDYDRWDSYLQYTWFQGSHHIHTTLDPNNTQITLLPAWQIPDFLDPHYASGSEKWKLELNIIDWDLARSYFVGQKLTVRPFFGARAAWIFQNVHVDYINQNATFLLIWPSTHISQSSNSWGIGPRTGISSSWNLGSGCRLYGNGEVDVLFTRYTTLKTRQTFDITSANRYLIKQEDANYLRAHVELALGIGWGTYFYDRRVYVDLSADYGYQVFFDQNMFFNFVSAQSVGKTIAPNGNLYVHGLTTTVRFDF